MQTSPKFSAVERPLVLVGGGMKMIPSKLVGLVVASFGAWSLFTAPAVWAEISIPDSVVNRVVIDPRDSNTIYAATDNGVFKSTDQAQSWFSINFGLPELRTQVVTVDPQDSNTIYVGVGEFNGIFKSTNAGASWEPTGSLSPLFNVHDIAIDPWDSNTVFAGGNGSVSYGKSINGGLEWSPGNHRFGHAKSIAIDPRDTNTIYMALARFQIPAGGLIKTIDGGDNWTLAEVGLPPLYGRFVALDPQDSTTVYMAFESGGVYKSTNGAKTWSTTGLGAGISPYGLAIDPNDSNTLYVGTYREQILKSTDGGDTWYEAHEGISSRPVLSLAIDPKDSNTIYAGTGRGLFKSVDGSKSWFLTGE